MNINEYYKDLFINFLKDYKINEKLISKINIENPKQKNFGDVSFNAPLILASEFKRKPLDIANEIAEIIKKNCKDFEEVQVANPGFINLTFKKNVLTNYIKNIHSDFGRPEKIIKKKINIEFVSANPTGPLHVGHCRGAVYGDILGNLLSYCGHEVTKEYYINDYGNQINLFIKSVYARILELEKGKKFPNDQNLYPGEYIIDIANEVLKKIKNRNFDKFDLLENELTELSIHSAMDIIKENLNEMGIVHDIFISEKDIVNANTLSKALELLKNKNDIYYGTLPKPKGDSEDWESREQLLFKSTKYGDDIDRALQKSDKTWTYFANDIAYHFNKLNRGFDTYINILGADHAGYLKRLSAAVMAMNNNKKFEIKISQIVKLFKSGKPFRMSKRAGDFILAKDLVAAVGKDATRFMMVYRSSQSPLDFDFDVVNDKSKDNPIFYVQYACARLNSLFEKSNLNIDNYIDDADTDILNSEIEMSMIKKILQWPKIINLCNKTYEVHYIPFYLYELSSEFHHFWNAGKQNEELRIIGNANESIVRTRLFLMQKIYFILKRGLDLLGVSAPKKM